MAAPVVGTTLGFGDTGTSSDTVQSFTTGAGETHLVVAVGIKGVSMSTINGITFGATSLTVRQAETTDATIVLHVYSGTVPESTTANITVDYNGGNANAVIAAVALTGVTAVGNSAKQNTNSTPATLSLTGVTAGHITLSFINTAAGDANPTKDSTSTTLITRFHDGAVIVEMDSQWENAKADPSWTALTHANDTACHVAIALLGIEDVTGAAAITLEGVTIAGAGTIVEPVGGPGFGTPVTMRRYHRFHFGG